MLLEANHICHAVLLGDDGLMVIDVHGKYNVRGTYHLIIHHGNIFLSDLGLLKTSIKDALGEPDWLRIIFFVHFLGALVEHVGVIEFWRTISLCAVVKAHTSLRKVSQLWRLTDLWLLLGGVPSIFGGDAAVLFASPLLFAAGQRLLVR